jgi:NAD(P)-dependent dehydrogenase (short-subunit alcohol dehydrogenase family)
MTELFAAATAVLGGLDGVVVNVGMGGPQWLSGTSAAAWDRTFALNARAHFLGCKLALQHLDDDGAVVLVSSVASLKPGSRMPAYDSSKAALAGLCRHAAFEGRRRRVRVNVVLPGLIDTPMGRAATQARPGRTAGELPLGRQGSAWDVANGVLYLMSNEAGYVNGQLLAVDGGLTTIH